jgi:hypothetical protein
MPIKFIRSISFVLGITALILVAPTVCAASMPASGMAMDASAAGSCQQMGTLGSYNSGNGAASHCALVNGTGELVKPQRVISHENVFLPPSLTGFEAGEYLPSQKPVPQPEAVRIPLPAPPEQNTRSSTVTEEPPL